jgi:hypothetical protein
MIPAWLTTRLPSATRQQGGFTFLTLVLSAELGPCVRAERCTDLSEKALLSSTLLLTLEEVRAQRLSS